MAAEGPSSASPGNPLQEPPPLPKAVWQYDIRGLAHVNCLEEISMEIVQKNGQRRIDLLAMGDRQGQLSFCKLLRPGQKLSPNRRLTRTLWSISEPKRVWPPLNVGKQIERGNAAGYLSLFNGCAENYCLVQDEVTCLKKMDEYQSAQPLLITDINGVVILACFKRPFDSNEENRWAKCESHFTGSMIYSADCSSKGNQIVIGSNEGVALVNMEAKAESWVCRTKAIFNSLQLHQSGNVVVCGLDNGAVVTVDVRQRQDRVCANLAKNRLPYPSRTNISTRRRSSKKWFQVEGEICPESTFFLPSSISCVKFVPFYDQYLLASSADACIKLYDHRMIQRGAVVSYEGNTYCRWRPIQFGIDHSGRFLLSGGVDCCCFRIWNIMSAELLFEEKISDYPLVMCWPQTQTQTQSSHAWAGSWNGRLFRMQW